MYIYLDENMKVIGMTTGDISNPEESGCIKVNEEEFEVSGLYYNIETKEYSTDSLGLDLVVSEDDLILVIGDEILDGGV